MPRTITFPPVEPHWVFDRDCVRFYAVDEQVVVNCLVTGEALFSHFGAVGMSVEECLRAFRDHRPAVEDVARRKLLSLPPSRPGYELLLLDTDFPLVASTSAPPPGQTLLWSVDASQVTDDLLMRGVEAAMSVVRGELGRAGTRLRADWKLIPAPGGLNLAKLTLTDLESDASAEGLYTRADLNNVSIVRFAMYRLWGDLLREKGRRQAAALQPAGVGE